MTSNQKELKFALISHVLPPSGSGQAVALYRLLRGVDRDRYCLMSRQNYGMKTRNGEASARLGASYHHLPPVFGTGYFRRVGLSGAGEWLQTIHRARQISRILRAERCGAVVSCSGDLYDLPAGFLASRWARARFYAYLFDDYLYQWTEPSDRSFARRWEKMFREEGTRVIVPNEFLAEAYAQRYGAKPVVIHNPCEGVEVRSGAGESWPAHPGEIKIIYTGAIYHAHYDAFHNLLRAIGEMEHSGIKLYLYTSQPRFDLEQRDIRGPVVIQPHLPASHVAQIQRQADILFLPLAFDSPFPEIIRTSAPGKMGEYLSSGRPILVHAPSDSFLSWYFRKNACGLVVEQNDPAALTRAIRELLGNAVLRENLGKNALDRARRDFSPGKAGSEFLRLFQTIREGQGCASSS